MGWMIAASLFCQSAIGADKPTLSWSDVAKQPLPAAGTHLAYGKDALEFGEMRLPSGSGPFPIVILFHGGCWLSDFDYKHVTPLAAALTKAGYATWTPEYRRIGNDGGGWPGTFDDARAATDFLRDIAREHPIDLKRVAFVGHSAGGQIALWLASREGDPVRPKAVVGLAAITDLEAYREGPKDSCHASVEPLMGGTPEQQPLHYAQVSPVDLLPMPIPTWLIQGERDPIVSLDSAKKYADAAGSRVKLVTLPQAGHFELVVPEGVAWAALLAALKAGL